MAILDTLRALVLPKGKPNTAATSVTTTYNQSAPNTVLTVPTYREHLEDIWSGRGLTDSRALIQTMLRTDPDMSAALNAFLTVANTEPVFLVRNPDTSLDSTGQELLNKLLVALQIRSDY